MSGAASVEKPQADGTSEKSVTLSPDAPLPPKVVLHVGSEKTGSTSVQNFLHSHRSELLRQHVLFPGSVFTRKVPGDPERTSGHLELIRNLVAGDIGEFEAELRKDGAGVHTLLLSMENVFHFEMVDHLRLLAKLLEGAHLTLIVVLRRQDEWLQSYYTESVQGGWNVEARSIDRFADALLASGKLDYERGLKRMIDIFLPDDVRVLNYNALERGEGILSGFFGAASLSIEPQLFSGAARSHVTNSYPEAIEATRRLNAIASVFWSRDMHDWARALRVEALRLGGKRHHGALPSLQPRRETRQAILRALQPSNQRLARRYLDGAAFGPPADWPEEPSPELDEALVDEIVDCGMDLFRSIRSRAESLRKPDGPKYPPLNYRDEELSLLYAEVRRSRCLLGYGAGATAYLASWRCNCFGIFVESDPERQIMLQYQLDRLDLPSVPVIYAVPRSDQASYARSVWSEPFFRHPDLVLIEGAFRLACLTAVCLETERPVRVLYHDFGLEPERHLTERVLPPTRMVEQMAVFDLNPETCGDQGRELLAGIAEAEVRA